MLPLPGTWRKKRANSRANAAQGLLCRFRDPTKFTAESVMFCCIPLRDTTTRCRKRPFKGPSSRCRTKSVLPEPVSPTKIVEWATSRYRLVDAIASPFLLISPIFLIANIQPCLAIPPYLEVHLSACEQERVHSQREFPVCFSGEL